MPYVNLPPGNRSLQMEDGTRYVAGRSGGRVEVSEDHARAIDRLSGNGTAGLLTAQWREYGGSSRPGRVCTSCGFIAYAWATTCPRTGCGAPTQPE